MKLKARDIVKGWPRSRSTSYGWPRSDCYLEPFFLLLNKPPRGEFIDEAIASREYHRAQQRMNDACFERWRKPLPRLRIPLSNGFVEL